MVIRKRKRTVLPLVLVFLLSGCGEPGPGVLREAEYTLLGPRRQVYAVSFSHDGERVACSGRGVRVWKPGSGFDEITRLGGRGLVYGISCSPSGHETVTP